MTDTNMPSEAAIREAWKRAGVVRVGDTSAAAPMTILAAQLIEKFEPHSLIDPVVLRAREIVEKEYGCKLGPSHQAVKAVIRALREGMPK